MMQYSDEVFDCLVGSDWVTGRELRNRLNADRSWFSRWSVPAFYAMMSKFVYAELVECKTETHRIDGVPITFNYYRVVPESIREVREG